VADRLNHDVELAGAEHRQGRHRGCERFSIPVVVGGDLAVQPSCARAEIDDRDDRPGSRVKRSMLPAARSKAEQSFARISPPSQPTPSTGAVDWQKILVRCRPREALAFGGHCVPARRLWSGVICQWSVDIL